MENESPWPRAYRITSSRIELRCLEPTDALAIKALVDSSKELARALELPEAPEPVEHMLARVLGFRRRFDSGEAFHYAALIDGELFGSIAVEPIAEGGVLLGGWVHPDHARRGLATHACAVACHVAFSIGGARFIETRVTPDNTAIQQVVKKLGFAHEATLAGRVVMRGVAHDQMIWTLWSQPLDVSLVSVTDAIGRSF